MNGMADEKKSREVITDEISYRKDIKEFNPFRYSGGDNEVRIADDDGKSSDMTIRITADVGDALTGFKALQRELRETTKAARELEQAYKDVEKVVNLSEIKTSLCDCRTINRCDDGKCRG